MMRPWLISIVIAVTSISNSSAEGNWPFDQPKNVAVITQKQIVQGKAPILRVTHDADDHGWQFLNPSIETTSANAAVISLEQVAKLDPSVLEVANLPVGWIAWRKDVGAKWALQKLPPAAQR